MEHIGLPERLRPQGGSYLKESQALSLFAETDGKVRAMGSHHSTRAKSHVWLTPRFILDALGEFDLDPCAGPEPRPWPTAKAHWTHGDNSLGREWMGRVWLNPPYGLGHNIGPWMRRLAAHGRGTALVFARTETKTFFDAVWDAPTAKALLFFRGRLYFHRADGSLPKHKTGSGNAGAPSVLIAYGMDDARRLSASGLDGQFVQIRTE